jgi:hypothetical protein
MIEQDVKSGHSIVVLDLRGDLVAGALGVCVNLGIEPERVTLLDLREEVHIQGFNPLSGSGKTFIKALHLLDVVAAESSSWGVQLEETLRSALLLLAESSKPITNLERLFYVPDFRYSCLADCTDESVLAFWDRYERMSREKQNSWALPVLNKLSPLLSTPILRSVLSGSPDMKLDERLGEKGHVILVSLAVDELQRSGRMIGSLIVSAIAREMMSRVNVSEGLRNPVRLYVDEFENMASTSFEGLIAEGRRFGLTLVLSHQTLAQLPARLKSVVRNNVGLQVLFQCGFEDSQVLVKELPDEADSESLRTLGVGQAYVMYRDGDAELVQFHAPSRKPTSKSVRLFRKQVLEHLPLVNVRSNPLHIPNRPNSEVDLKGWL